MQKAKLGKVPNEFTFCKLIIVYIGAINVYKYIAASEQNLAPPNRKLG